VTTGCTAVTTGCTAVTTGCTAVTTGCTAALTDWVTLATPRVTGCTAAATGWVSLATPRVTGCTAAFTDVAALVAAAVTGCTAAPTGSVLLVTAAVTGSVADAVAADVPLLLDDELVGDGGLARAEDGGAETTGAGEGEVAAAGRVVVALAVAATSELAVLETVATAPVKLDLVGLLTPSADARLDPRNRTAMAISAPIPSRRRERRRHTKDALLSSGIGGFIRYQRQRGVVAAEFRDKSTRTDALPRLAVVRTANGSHCDLAPGMMRK
jgi:hypothetical protein